MKPKDTKRAINLLIGDIQDNEWYCIQGGSESELKDWEKELIVTGLRKLLKEGTRNEKPYGAKLCPFCAGEATMLPEGDYWEITCDDCGVFKQGSTYEQALNEWNLRRL